MTLCFLITYIILEILILPSQIFVYPSINGILKHINERNMKNSQIDIEMAQNEDNYKNYLDDGLGERNNFLENISVND